MLQVSHLTVTHMKDLRTLFSDLSFTLSGQERLAVIGEEGDGKSTLLKMIASWPAYPDYCLVQGSIAAPSERIAYLPQESETPCLPVVEYCQAYAGFQDAAWEDLASACRKVGLSVDLPYAVTPFSSLSGGERIKLRLMLLFLSSPTMLLLDEPTNDLDIQALDTLENILLTCRLPCLYVSHDEHLLDHTAQRILHLESIHGRAEPRWTLANIPYTEYMAGRADALRQQESAFQMEKRERRIRDEKMQRIEQAVDHAQASISRRDPHGSRLLKKKMKAVKSLEHRYAREDEQMTERPNIEWAIDASWMQSIHIPDGKRILSLDLPGLAVPGRTLCGNIRLFIRGNEHVFITGNNGCGKTTLLHLILQRLAEESGLKVGYMPQHYEEELPDDVTPIEFLHRDGTKESLTKLRSYLGAFRFTREEMFHPVSLLSGGQKAKLLVLRLILDESEILVLDEPTRNLSPLSAPVLRSMLNAFPGCLICVTHDRTLLSQAEGRILSLDADGLHEIPHPI